MVWTIVGGPLNGYRLHDTIGDPSIWHFTKMWDAIRVRDSINRGEMKVGENYKLTSS